MNRSQVVVGAVVALLLIVGFFGIRIATTPEILTPSPSPSATPTPSPTFDPGAGIGRCPTGYTPRPGEPAPEPLDTDVKVLQQGEGDRCSFLSLYLADPGAFGDNPTLARDAGVEAPTYAETGVPGPLRAVSLVSGVEVPGIAMPDGGYRFAIAPDIPWKIVYRDPSTGRPGPLLILEDCPAPDANLTIRSVDRIRLVLRAYRYRDTVINVCSRPRAIALDAVVFRRDDTELSGELAPLPPPRPFLNPIRLGADAAAANYWSADYIEALLAAERTRGQTSLFAITLFLTGSLLVTAVGAFAIWLLFASGEREPRTKRPPRTKGRKGVRRGPSA
jgi:hypothetical protein